MIIAVNTRFLLNDYLEGYGNFIFETFQRITSRHTEHRFIFIFDRPYNKSQDWGSNVEIVVAGPPARHPILWKFWYDVKIPSVLKKYKADVFVSPDGFCSLYGKIPQCVVVHDLAFLHYPSAIPKTHLLYYKGYTPKYIAKANSVATVSAFSKNDIIENYSTDPEKISVVYNGVKQGFRPLTFEQKTIVKEKYTDGKEYFLYTGSIHPRKNLINLLKAFSLFKKRQQTKMKLVITGRLAWKYESFTRDLQSYKYRDEVLVTGYVEQEELEKITASAYAMVYPSLFEGFGVPILEAMRSDVPVITSRGSAMQEIAGDAALYADPTDPQSIAEQMMLLYKNENLGNQLVQKGRTVADEYNWDKTAELLWDCICKAIG